MNMNKRAFERGTLCECTHKRVQHRLLSTTVEQADWEALDENVVICVCDCQQFGLITNLKYLELLEKEKSDLQ